jgi:hypothetical protein
LKALTKNLWPRWLVLNRHLMIDRGKRDVETYRFPSCRSPIADYVIA